MGDTTGGAGSNAGAMPWNQFIGQYGSMQTLVSNQMGQIGSMSAGGVQMQALFQLQLQMNVLSLFGSTLTNVMEGVQQVAMSISRNTKGS